MAIREHLGLGRGYTSSYGSLERCVLLAAQGEKRFRLVVLPPSGYRLVGRVLPAVGGPSERARSGELRLANPI